MAVIKLSIVRACRNKKKEREELKANIAKLLNKKLSKREIVRSGLADNPRVQQREFNARQRYLALFDEYSKQRKKQHKSKRKNEFKLSDIRELFGMQATTVDRAISNGQIKSTIGKPYQKVAGLDCLAMMTLSSTLNT